MRCWIEISSDAIKQNYQIFKRISEPATLVPVIKSNAYGHGFQEIYSILQDLQPSWLAVNYLEEAETLRDLNFKGSILIVGPVSQGRYADAYKVNADIFIGDERSLSSWLACKEKPRIHIKVDTGMSRQGFQEAYIPDVLNRLLHHKEKVIGIASHFANVEDVMDLTYAQTQMRRFEKAVAESKSKGFNLLNHISSSASTLLLNDAHLGLTRVGISLYGLWPSQTTKLSFLQTFDRLEPLKPALAWKTEVALTKTIPEGDFIGYGCTYKTMKAMNIAVLPVGYFEGVPRLVGGKGYVLIHGKRCPILGRICMNMMMVDISHLSDVNAGDIVTLIGKDGNEVIDADTFGSWADTIHYEALTCLNSKIPRRIVP